MSLNAHRSRDRSWNGAAAQRPLLKSIAAYLFHDSVCPLRTRARSRTTLSRDVKSRTLQTCRFLYEDVPCLLDMLYRRMKDTHPRDLE